MGAGASSSNNSSITVFPNDLPPGKYSNLTLQPFDKKDTQVRLLNHIKNKQYLEARRLQVSS